MTRDTINLSDRWQVYEVGMHYAWSLDRGDWAGAASVFTADAEIETPDGRVFQGRSGVQEFVKQASSRDGFYGRQHHIQPIRVEASDDGLLVTSYWIVVTWHAGAAPFIVSMGHYRDLFVHEGEGWLLRNKVIAHWNDQTDPPRASAQAAAGDS